MTDQIREQIVDELSGWPIGSGYYQTKVDPSEAQEMADAILAALDKNEWATFQPAEITRIAVIGDRVWETYADECYAQVQDGGHTLKLFPYGEGIAAQEVRAKALLADLKEKITKKACE